QTPASNSAEAKATTDVLIASPEWAGRVGGRLLDAEEVGVEGLAAAVELDLEVGVLVGEPALDRGRRGRIGIGARDDGEQLAVGTDQLLEQALRHGHHVR